MTANRWLSLISRKPTENLELLTAGGRQRKTKKSSRAKSRSGLKTALPNVRNRMLFCSRPQPVATEVKYQTNVPWFGNHCTEAAVAVFVSK